MNGLNNIIFADKIIRFSTAVSFGLLLITIAYIALYYRQLPPVLPLYNQMPWGEDRLGGTIEIGILPLITMIIIIVNTLVASFLYEKMPLVARALSVTTILISLITIIFIFRTVQLVL